MMCRQNAEIEFRCMTHLFLMNRMLLLSVVDRNYSSSVYPLDSKVDHHIKWERNVCNMRITIRFNEKVSLVQGSEDFPTFTLCAVRLCKYYLAHISISRSLFSIDIIPSPESYYHHPSSYSAPQSIDRRRRPRLHPQTRHHPPHPQDHPEA